MASLPTIPIVIIDEEEVIVIEDESGDEIEILEHGFPTKSQTPRTDNPSSYTWQNTNPSTKHHPERSLIHRKQPSVSMRYSHRQLSCELGSPVISNTMRTPSNRNGISTAVSTTRRRHSQPKTLSLELSSKLPNSPPSTENSPRERSIFSSFILPREVEGCTSVDATTSKCCKTTLIRRPSATNRSDSRSTTDNLLVEALHSERGSVEREPFIALDGLANFDDLWSEEEELQILHVEERKTTQQPRRHSSQAAVEQRNAPIIPPLVRLQEWFHKAKLQGREHRTLLLRPSEMVELHEGDFLLITDIIQHSKSGETTLRGKRLQRCRSMNGLLERKLNEVCFFYEVDLDDQRPPEEQSAIEVSVNMVKDLRSVRKTNQLFPACRNITLEDFRNQLQAAKEGGLTARWKYTCTYASAADRWDNNLKERTLEVLRERECTSGFGVSDIMQRFGWRGETIPGGAYLPDLHVEKELIETSRKESVISLASSTPESESDCLIIESPTASAKIAGKRHIDLSSSITPTPCRKRRPSSLNEGLAQDESRNNSKKVRIENEKEVEVTRRELSTLHVEEEVIVLGKASDMVDMTVDASSSQSQPRSLVATNIAPLRYSQHSAASKIALAIDVSSSELASPPPTGAVQYGPISEKGTVFRSPGQMLTYGDAFCGAGGTTRGAAMAGLRVVWGFDHWNQACSTWRANFPYATCYELTSQRFIVTTQGSKFRKPVDVKVDVLHLSPPCQYFSPAHTVNCPNDEMNIASLFAVGAVIKAARPRIVTLEQTFGIVATRFYRYFNSLIHMFTALNFSVRWAVVPLAQWGLPQRRCRLIIIAACPGEVLPKMPSPTHSDSSDDGLLPFATVNHTLSQIPDDAPDHDPDSLVFPANSRRRPWDGNAILPRAMTTSGGQNYHPSGERDFTLREYAALQGFPPNHMFVGSYVKKQIGNAVPPCIAKVLFESIKKQLDEVDGIVQEKETMVID